VEPIVAVWVRAPVASLTHGDAGRHRTGARSRPTRRAAGSPRRGRKPRGSAGRVPAPAAPEHKSRGPGGHRPLPRLPLRSEGGRPDGRDPTQLHAVHVQSTFSPRSVHFQSTWGSTYVATRSPRTWIHVDPMAFNVERSSGGQGGRGWRPGRAMRPPYASASRATRRSYMLGSSAGPLGAAGMAGRSRDNIQ
jgi:hypothetical protein